MSVSGEQSITPALLIAIEEINNNQQILSNYKLELIPYESNIHEQDALKYAPKLREIYQNQCNNNQNQNNLLSPILFAPTWSESGKGTAFIFDELNLIQIASCSTSTELTKSKYASFIRTIPSDALQGNAIAKLSLHYNWKRIGLIHVNGFMGLEKAISERLEVESVAYDPDDLNTLKTAAKYIYDHKLYVTALHVRGDHISLLFDELNKINATEYPYHYIGTDITWWDEATIANYNLSTTINGYFGILPAAPWMLKTKEQFKRLMDLNDEMAEEIYRKSHEIKERIKNKWDTLQLKNNELLNNYIHFAYDSVYTLALSLEKLDKIYPLNQVLACWNSTNSKLVHDELMRILINNMGFAGITGNVSFDSHGDRAESAIAIGNIYSDGTINYFAAMHGDNFVIFDDPVWRYKKMPITSEYSKNGVGFINLVLYFVLSILVIIILWLLVQNGKLRKMRADSESKRTDGYTDDVELEQERMVIRTDGYTDDVTFDYSIQRSDSIPLSLDIVQ